MTVSVNVHIEYLDAICQEGKKNKVLRLVIAQHINKTVVESGFDFT